MVAALLIILGIIGGAAFWANSSENACWQYEATQAFEHYKTLRSRSAILREAASSREVKDPKANPLEVNETDPNGCSLGSNGMTVVRFHFDDAGRLTKMQVVRHYISAGTGGRQGEVIEERKF